MGTPAQSLPPWEQAAQQLPPWEQAKRDAAPQSQATTAASGAGGSWTPAPKPVAQTATGSNTVEAFDPGFRSRHPIIGPLVEGGLDALQGGGRELIGEGIRLAKYVSPKGGAALQRLAGDYATPIPGKMETAGRIGTQIGEFEAPGGAENMAAHLAEEALPMAPAVLRGAAKLLPYAATGAGVTALQGGSPTAGALAGAGGEAAAQGLRALAKPIARAALGLRRIDFAYGAAPDEAALEYTRGIRPGTVAESARGVVGERSAVLNRLADEASQAQVHRVPQPLALPPGPIEREAVPLHAATAVVERPSMLQPAAKAPGRVVTENVPAERGAGGRIISGPQRVTRSEPMYLTSPATLNIPGATSGQIERFARMRNPAEDRAVEFLDRLDSEGGNGITYPEGRMPDGAVAHPQQEPLRTIRREEPAQGVWLRTPEGYTPPVSGGGGDAFTAQPRATVSLRPARQVVDEMSAVHGAQNNETALRSLDRVRSQLTKRALTGDAIPEQVTPREALDLKRGVRNQFAKYRSEPQYDHSVASHAAKSASRALDPGLTDALGPQFTEANRVIHSTLPIAERAESLANGEGTLGRTLHRIGAHTGALTGAAVGADYGARHGGLGGALQYGALGLLGPELLASPEFGMAGARALYSPAGARIALPLVQAGMSNATQKPTRLKGIGHIGQ